MRCSNFVRHSAMLQARERGHVEGLNLWRIAIGRAVGTGVAVETTAGSARRAVLPTHMRQTGLVRETIRRISVDRTGFQTRFVDTCIAKVNHFASFPKRNLVLEQQRAAIGVPEPVLRMHENAERRRFQTLRPHRPLLERQIWPVGRRHGARAEFLRHCADHFARPCIERIGNSPRLAFPPAQEMRPRRSARLPHEQHGSGGSAGETGRCLLTACEIEAAAQDEAVGGQGLVNAFITRSGTRAIAT